MKHSSQINGIYIDRNKISSDVPVEVFPLPEELHIPLGKHIGKKAIPCVEEGEKVKEGQLIAKLDGVLSANIHSGVDGKVSKILDDFIVIEVAKSQKKCEGFGSSGLIIDIPEDKKTILKKIIKAGIVGMGGAGFPSAVKFDIPEGKVVNQLIINGMEGEPYFTSDTRLIIEQAEKIVVGARIINKLLGIQNALIVVEEENLKVVEIMRSVTKRYIGVNLFPIKNKYPQGYEKMLIKKISGVEVSSDKRPVDYGFLVSNVATVFAVYEAVMENKPLYERVLTVSGNDTSIHKNFLMKIGTPVSFIMKTLKISAKNKKVILGGMMMGRVIDDFNIPISKLDAGLLFLRKDDEDIVESPCIRCSDCSRNCPVNLQPFEIVRLYKNKQLEKISKLRPDVCINCGICSYVCPAKIPLLDYIKKVRKEIC